MAPTVAGDSLLFKLLGREIGANALLIDWLIDWSWREEGGVVLKDLWGEWTVIKSLDNLVRAPPFWQLESGWSGGTLRPIELQQVIKNSSLSLSTPLSRGVCITALMTWLKICTLMVVSIIYPTKNTNVLILSLFPFSWYSLYTRNNSSALSLWKFLLWLEDIGKIISKLVKP